jgi:Spx/MgsR family transcriptional regulator
MVDTAQAITYTLYGIKNCDTIKKARHWLEQQQITYRFHDYRVDGLDAALLDSLLTHQDWQAMLNTRGTTWRKLDEALRQSCTTQEIAKSIMLAQPAVIKRPLLLTSHGQSLLGFNAENYQQFFSKVK